MVATAFDRYGGFSAVRRIVSSFYDKVLDSETLERHFSGVDMRSLIDHQTKFISSIMGGPAAYSDDVLERVHAHLNITSEEYAELTELMRETLEEFDLDEADINEICGEITRRQSVIVGRS
jgi:hemoglobin